MTDWTAPIIVVGAGRSGTTRLTATLAAHRDVYMLGETSFLLHRMWTAFHEQPAYVRNWRLGQLAQQTRAEWRAVSWGEFWNSAAIGRNLANLGPELDAIERAETSRLQRLFGAFLAEALIPPSLRAPRWGFKEIWGGSGGAAVDWSLYHAAYPAAHFVHSMRHPVAYLRSALSHRGRADAPPDTIVHELREWVAMVRHARGLASTGRYVEFRMEDFDAALPRLLDALGLEPDPACEVAARVRYLPSEARAIAVPPPLLDEVVGLRPLCLELGYDLPG